MRESEYQHSEPLVSEVVAIPPTTDVFTAPDTKDARMTEALSRLDAGIEQLLEDPASYFRVMARFHKFSLSNQLMIFAQDRHATQVMGYGNKEGTTGWKSIGRQVQKGAKAIKIFYPKFRKELDPQTGDKVQLLTGFGIGNVFDVRNTEGDPLPERPDITEDVSTTDVSTAVNLKLSRWCIDQGLRMESVPFNGHAQGDYTPSQKRIRVRISDVVEPLSIGKTKTLVHEAAHYVAGHDGGIDREDAETVAEASAFVTMSHFAIDTGSYSFPYIAGWAEDKERLHANLTEIRRVGNVLINAIEGVGDPYEDDFGSFDQIGEGELSRKFREQGELVDAYAPNL